MIIHAPADEFPPGLRDRLAVALGFAPEDMVVSLHSHSSLLDGTTVLHISDGAGRPRAVMLRSSPNAPNMIERAMKRAQQAKIALGPQAGSVILDPLCSGRLDALSYAVLPYCEPLRGSRPRWWLQRAKLTPKLLDWLWHANERTVRDVGIKDVDGQFRAPLRHLASLTMLSESLREAAKKAEDRLNRGAWIPKVVLSHGDLWKGNILLRSETRTNEHSFVVIDWAGSELQGHAIYDLIRLAQSMGLRRRRLGREINRHCGVLGCEVIDAKSYLLTALGHLGMNLEHFPREAYTLTAESCFAVVECAIC